MKPIRSLHTLALIATIAATGAASAADPVGRVLLAAGDTFAVRDGKEIRLAFNSPIEFKDVLRTGPASSLQVRFVDDSMVSIREGSEFAIEEYQFGNKEEEQRSFFRLVKGGFRAVTGLIGRANHANYRVRAETATVGIRGTDYAIRECRGDCGAGVKDGLYGTVLGLSNGTNQITVTNNSGESTFGINQNFYVANANTRPEPLLAPPSFVAVKPQGKAQATQQGGSGTGGEQASSSSGTSADSRPQQVVQTTSVTTTPITTTTTQYSVTNTVTSSGTTTVLPAFTLGGLGIVPGSGIGVQFGGVDGGGALLTASMLTLNSSGLPTAINIPSGCTGPNGNDGCKGGFNASLPSGPVEFGSASPDGSPNKIFWGRWTSGTVVSDTSNTLSSTVQAHFMYGTLTPADTLAAKTGSLTLHSNSLGTTPTNNFGATPSSYSVPTITVNFDTRTASVTTGFASFGSAGTLQNWSTPSGSGAITIVPGSGGYFQMSGGATCSGTGCNGATSATAKAAGIFFGPVGDHAGVAMGATAFNSSGQTVANFGTVRIFCPSGC